MVAAGVIPIDRLTDIRAPVDVVAARCGQPQLESVYGIQLGPRTLDPAAAAGTAAPSGAAASITSPAAAVPGANTSSSATSSSSRVPAGQTGAEAPQLPLGARLLRSLARARGWAASGGLPDEVRAGRQILKDYTNGKLLFCKLPPGQQRTGFAPAVAPLAGTVNAMHLQQQEQPVKQQAVASNSSNSSSSSVGQQEQQSELRAQEPAQQSESSSLSSEAGLAGAVAADTEPAVDGGPDLADASTLLLSEADLELMEGLGVGSKAKARRPDHKFQKKAARTKGTRGLAADAGGYDGAALSTGKKGGLVRVGGY